jgi:GntR family transcriptional regulator
MASIAKRPPLYQEVADVLAQRISQKNWAPGLLLPSELELSDEMGVSPGTVRRALEQLEAERLVVRQQGRGTFVTEQACSEFAARFNNVRDKNGNPMPFHGKVLEQTRGVANQQEQQRLGLRADEPVLRTRRLCTDASRHYMYEQTCLVLGQFSGLTGEGLGNYSLSALAQQHGIRLASATEQVSACRAPADVARLLGVESDAVVLQLDRIVVGGNGKSVEWRVAYCLLSDNHYLVKMS